MKRLAAVCSAFLLLLGMMMGQEKPTRQVTMIVADFANGAAIVSAPTCNDELTFRDTTKLIRDIFPEECGTGIVNPLNKREAQWDVGTADAETVVSGHVWKLSELQPFYLAAPQKPDPPDVPAVKKTRPAASNCNTILPGDNLVMPYRRLSCFPADEDYWTCADPTRGLWHDELPEPKIHWYCRKAQTE